MKYILLDRDGTIIKDKHYLSNPEGVELLPNAALGLKAMQEAGYGLIVVTNQSGIGRGYYEKSDMDAVNERMKDLLRKEGVELAEIFFCPHAPDQSCNCRKPLTGMFDQAIDKFAFNPQESYVIGDKICDVKLGLAKQAGAILVRTGKGAKEEAQCSGIATCIADDLLQAAQFIASGEDL